MFFFVFDACIVSALVCLLTKDLLSKKKYNTKNGTFLVFLSFLFQVAYFIFLFCSSSPVSISFFTTTASGPFYLSYNFFGSGGVI